MKERISKCLALLFASFVVLTVVYIILWNIYGASQEDIGEIPLLCPSVYHLEGIEWIQHGGSGDHVNCSAILNGEIQEIVHANQMRSCQVPDLVEYPSSESDTCRVSNPHGEYPIAFSILAHENALQLKLLFEAVYNSQNVYCIHIDKHAHRSLHDLAADIASCHGNVYVASSREILWGHISILEAELSCVRLLWNSTTKWKYWINLTGRDFPLRTNQELVQILKILNGTNEITGSVIRPLEWTSHKWAPQWSDEYKSIVMTQTNSIKGYPPLNLTLYKGSAHVIASRDFVHFILSDGRIQQFYDWINDINVPDEHFFNTLHLNSFLKAPGGLTDPDLGDGDSIARYKVWKGSGIPCDGRILRSICSFGAGDLHRVIQSPALFANKFHMEWEAVPFNCLRLWHRMKKPQNLSTVDENIYRSLSYLKQTYQH